MPDDETPQVQPEDEQHPPEDADEEGALDQAAINALLGGAAADEPEPPPPAAEADPGGLLDQDAIDALLGGGGSSDILDQDAIEALLTAQVGDEEAAPAAADDEGGGSLLLDQDALDALWAQAGVSAAPPTPPPPPAPAAWTPPAASAPPPTPPPERRSAGSATCVGDLDLLADVILTVSAEIGRTEMTIEDVLKIGPGSLIELDKLAGEPVELFVNDRCIARGEVVVVEDCFGVRITELGR